MKSIGKGVFIAVIWFLLSFLLNVSFAEDVRVQAHVDNNKTTVGESIVLSLTIEGKSNAPGIVLPQIDGFDVSGGGQMMNTSINNGAVSSSVTQQYYLMPQKKGHFQIPSLDVTIDGKVYKTELIDIDVFDAGSMTSVSPSSGVGGDVSPNINDKVLVTLNFERTEVFINEKIPVRVTLLAHDISMQIEGLPKLDGDGFRLEDFDKGVKGRKAINGIEYEAVQFRANLYPTRVGEVIVGPARIPGSLIIKTGNGMDQRFGSLFDDDFFNQAFNRFTKKPVELKSADIILHVLDLPIEGKPEGFSGAVGKYEFEATASPLEVHVGDPVTVRLIVRGNGNLPAVNLKSFENNNDFKVYDPTTKQTDESKSVEQVVVPKNVDVKEIPAVRFSYFDTESRKYETIERGPFALTVLPFDVSPSNYEKVDQSTQKDGPQNQLKVDDKIGSDLIFIKDQSGKWRKRGEVFYRNLSFWIFLMFYGALWFLLFLQIKTKKRLKTDLNLAKQFLAPRFARQGLKEIKEAASNAEKEKFYDAVHRTVLNYFSYKLKIPVGNVDVLSVTGRLSRKRVPEKILVDFKYVLDTCETARFAPGSNDSGNMNEIVARVEKLIDIVERTFR